jgi:hypothetical protein
MCGEELISIFTIFAWEFFLVFMIFMLWKISPNKTLNAHKQILMNNMWRGVRELFAPEAISFIKHI